jgi:hypothetical protein
MGEERPVMIRVIVKMGIDGGVGLAKSANRDKIKTS